MLNPLYLKSLYECYCFSTAVASKRFGWEHRLYDSIIEQKFYAWASAVELLDDTLSVA